MIMVRIIFLDETETVKEYTDESEISLINVKSYKIIRDERKKVA